MKTTTYRFDVIDLFCGCGGVSFGYALHPQFRVLYGVDTNKLCRTVYEHNIGNDTFVYKPVEELDSVDVHWWGNDAVRVLHASPPCQSFSFGKIRRDDDGRKYNLDAISATVQAVQMLKPDVFTFEEVVQVRSKAKEHIQELIETLTTIGHIVPDIQLIDLNDYGLPQRRKRVFFISARVNIPLPKRTRPETAYEAISGLPTLTNGETNEHDSLHRVSILTDKVRTRFEFLAIDGNGIRDLPDALNRESWKSNPHHFPTIALQEDEAFPTILCSSNVSCKRFHKYQHRWFSLRELAILQGFPPSFDFEPDGRLKDSDVATMIGNAVPPLFIYNIAHQINTYYKCN